VALSDEMMFQGCRLVGLKPFILSNIAVYCIFEGEYLHRCTQQNPSPHTITNLSTPLSYSNYTRGHSGCQPTSDSRKGETPHKTLKTVHRVND